MGSEIAHMSHAERQERHARHWKYADQLMTMFVRGDSYNQMVAATGVPRATIHKIIHSAGAQYVTERYGDRTVVLGRELSILDALTRANLRAALDGDEKAARIVLEARRSARRLLGLDAAIKAEVTVRTAQDIEIERLVKLMTADPRDEPEPSPDTVEGLLKL